jgi:hypothetical protein
MSEVYPPTSITFEFDFERTSASKNDLKVLIQQVSNFILDHLTFCSVLYCTVLCYVRVVHRNDHISISVSI